MAAPLIDQDTLGRLFPASSSPVDFTNRPAPTPSAGITPKSTETLRELLKADHQRFHAFFNEKVWFHNHMAHHLFVAYGLGAPLSVLRPAFDQHSPSQLAAYKSPELSRVITRLNSWANMSVSVNTLNNLVSYGLNDTLERFVLSHEANWAVRNVRILDRFLSGLVHSMLYFGHAAEFGVPGLAVEGEPYASRERFDGADMSL
ncbi:hypothetical protein BDV93DRAFT_450779 [Ceratobasidium sp. AG-I]|nr:hypothetical protein BDV93DRAFT_450779 [Ceratobasidium sp. AG-I]